MFRINIGRCDLQKMVAEYINEDEGFRKEKERQIVEEGRSVRIRLSYHYILSLSTDLSGTSRNRRKETFCSGMLMT